jgi:aconitate hydratase
LGLAEFTLSRKDPGYVARAKEVKKAEDIRVAGDLPSQTFPQMADVIRAIRTKFPDSSEAEIGIGSVIYAVKPGDGSAREQAASCQRVLGGLANIAREYATKRYRSNLINWGMLPFVLPEEEMPFENGDYLFIPDIAEAVQEESAKIAAYVVKNGTLRLFELEVGDLTQEERQIILKGCLINYNRV